MATQYRSPGWPSHYTGVTTHNGTRVTTSTPYRPSPKYTTVADSSSDLTGTQLWSCTGFRLCQLLLPSQCSCVFRENCLEASNKELTQICICPWLRTSYWQFKEVKQRTVLQIKYFIWCMHEINNSQYNQWLYSTAINAVSHSHCFHPHLWAYELKLEERWTKLRFPRLWQVPTEQAGPRVGPSGRGSRVLAGSLKHTVTTSRLYTLLLSQWSWFVLIWMFCLQLLPPPLTLLLLLLGGFWKSNNKLV